MCVHLWGLPVKEHVSLMSSRTRSDTRGGTSLPSPTNRLQAPSAASEVQAPAETFTSVAEAQAAALVHAHTHAQPTKDLSNTLWHRPKVSFPQTTEVPKVMVCARLHHQLS